MESGAHLVNESGTEMTERIDEPANVFEGLSRVSIFTQLVGVYVNVKVKHCH